MANRFPLIVDSSNQNIKELPDGDSLLLGDSEKLLLGDGTDLSLYHDGSNSYLTNATGALKLATESSGIAITIGHTTSETTIGDNLTVTGDLSVGGVTLPETIADTVGAMVTSNTESGITVAYQDADNTLDFTIGTLNQNTTGSAATLTTARTIGGVSFDGSANIDLPGVNSAGNQNVDAALVDGENFKINGGQGTDGQVLTSTGSGVAWEDASGGGSFDPDGAVVFNDSSADVDFRIESNGNANMLFVDGGNDFISVGHGAPVHALHVYDSTTTSTHPELAVGIQTTGIKGHAIMQFWSSDNGTIHFGDAASPYDGYISYSHNTQSMEFGVNGATRMSLMYTGQSVGALRLGTTSVLSGSNEKVSVSGDGGITVKTNYWATYAPLTLWNNSTSGGTTYTYVYFIKPGGTVTGSITSSGTTTSYNTSSDYRLKENVDYTWDATTRLKQLKPARFNWITDETNTLLDGFLAHEVSSIVPESITGVKDETETNENCILNAAGNQEVQGVLEADWIAGKLPTLWTEDDELPEGVSVGDVREEAAYASDTTWVASHTQDVNQSIDQSKLVPLLVKTIQELEARITVLEG